MKRLFLLMCIALCTAAGYAAEGVTLGYCNGQWTRQSSISVDGNTWVDAAILLTTDMLEPYAGGQLTTIRGALAARTNIDNVRVWVRKALDGDDLAWAELSSEDDPGIVRGWNELELNAPYTITSAEPLYIGLSYKQRSTSAALSVVEGSHEGAFYFRGGDTASWEDRSAEGLLSLEAVVIADDMVAYDLRLLTATAGHNMQGGIDVTASVHNNGSMPVSGFTLTARVTDTDEVIDTHIAQPLANGASATYSFTLTPATASAGKEHAMTLDISHLDGDVSDEHPDNNAQPILFSFRRRVLIEEFTGEACTNCPQAAKNLHNALAIGDNSSRSAMMAHHAGYEPDWLTFYPSDVEYEWLFNHPKAVFAPALMFDRVAQVATYGTDTYMTPVSDPASVEVIDAMLNYYKNRPANVWIELTAEGDATLTVSVRGGRGQQLAQSDTRITVCIVEDHIEQHNQLSLTQWPEFEHYGVLRAINSTWGDAVPWDGDLFAATYQFTLDDSWQRDNLRVIAFLNNYDADDVTRCEVENCEQVSLNSTEAISTLQADAPTYHIYAPDGKRLDALRHGLNIVRQAMPDGTTRTTKIIY